MVGAAAGDRAVVDGALMLALTAAAVFRQPALAEEVERVFVPGVQV